MKNTVYFANIANFFGDKTASIDGLHFDVREALHAIVIKNNKTKMLNTLSRPIFAVPVAKRNEALSKGKTVKSTLLLDTFDNLINTMNDAHTWAKTAKAEDKASYIDSAELLFFTRFDAHQAHYQAIKNESLAKSKETKANNEAQKIEAQKIEAEKQALEQAKIDADSFRMSVLLADIAGAKYNDALHIIKALQSAIDASKASKANTQHAKNSRTKKVQALKMVA